MCELGEFPSQNVSRYHKQNIGPKTHSVMQQRESTMASFDGLAITETSRNFWHWLIQAMIQLPIFLWRLNVMTY